MLDQEINNRGIGVDLSFVHAAVHVSKAHTQLLMDEADMLAGISPKSVQQLRGWLEKELPEEYEVADLRKDTVAFLRAIQDDPLVDRVLEIRQEIRQAV